MGISRNGIIASGTVVGCAVAVAAAVVIPILIRRYNESQNTPNGTKSHSNSFGVSTCDNAPKPGSTTWPSPADFSGDYIYTPAHVTPSSYVPIFYSGPIENPVVSEYGNIKLCKQVHHDCWAYAAMFAAAICGKCNRVDMEKGTSPFRDAIMQKCNRAEIGVPKAQNQIYDIGSDGDSGDVENALRAMGVSATTIGGGMRNNVADFAGDLQSYFDKKAKVLCLLVEKHWLAVLPSKDGGRTYPVFDPLYGSVADLSAADLFARLSKTSCFGSPQRTWEVVYVV